MSVFVRGSIYSDVFDLAPKLRESDKREIWASSNSLPLAALKEGFRVSRRPYSIVYNNNVVAMFGHTKIDNSVGTIWLLASDELKSVQKYFISNSKKYIHEMLSDVPFLFNFAHAENQASLKWLKLCGANIRSPETHGLEKEKFCYFYFRR